VLQAECGQGIQIIIIAGVPVQGLREILFGADCITELVLEQAEVIEYSRLFRHQPGRFQEELTALPVSPLFGQQHRQ